MVCALMCGCMIIPQRLKPIWNLVGLFGTTPLKNVSKTVDFIRQKVWLPKIAFFHNLINCPWYRSLGISFYLLFNDYCITPPIKLSRLY